jgi:hypothetical protein
MNKTLFFVFLLSVTMFACKSSENQESENTEPLESQKNNDVPIVVGTQDSSGLEKLQQVYRNDNIGWSISIPNGWEIVDAKKLREGDEKGGEILSNEEDKESHEHKLEYMVAFQKDKDKRTMFTSVLEEYQESYKGEYAATFKDVINNVYNAYTMQEINVDTSSGMDTIAGIAFYIFNTAVYDKHFMYVQDRSMYSAAYKGYDVSFNMTYHDKKDFATMLKALNESKFD